MHCDEDQSVIFGSDVSEAGENDDRQEDDVRHVNVRRINCSPQRSDSGDSDDDRKEDEVRHLNGSPQRSNSGDSNDDRPMKGGQYYYSGRPDNKNYPDAMGRVCAGPNVGGNALSDAGDLPRNQGQGQVQQQPHVRVPECHVREMPGFQGEGRGEVLLGEGVKMVAPCFRQGCSGSSGWMLYAQSGVADAIAPVRVMCFNIPAECFSLDATKFTDWQTPMNNSVRVASIAALLGLVSTPLTKGFVSGSHEEIARAEANASGDQDGQRGGEAKKVKRVTWHMMPSADDSAQNIPMLGIGYEDIYNVDKSVVVAIRVWHFVFDESHSTSDVARRLMNENADESDHSGAAHCPNSMRKTTVVTAAKASRSLVGTSLESAQLELAAGMCYRHITNVAVYKNLLPHYAGQTDISPGLPPVDMERLPPGVLNSPMLPDQYLGCTHPLSLEWVFNAKRTEALNAGLVHLDGTPMKVNPDQTAVTSYFDISTPLLDDDSHRFRVPDWVGSEADGGKGCFFFQTDPFQRNVFDMVLPHSIAGSVKPGPELLKLYKQIFLKEGNDIHLSLDSPALLNRFNNTMTGRDQWMQAQINSLADSIVAYDTFECTAEQRMEAKTAKKAAARGIAHYGQMDGESHVIEPRQCLKEHAWQTGNIHSKLLAPWAANQRTVFAQDEDQLRDSDGGKHARTPIADGHFEKLLADKASFEKTYKKCMKELVHLHLAKMKRSFTSKIDKESIPAGYRAVWDGLHQELRDMPNGTANLAFAENMQLPDSDRTVFGHMTNWLGTFFEDDCFVDGRDWRLMQELFYHCFEQFAEQTMLLIFCGPKGNGKTLRTERAMKAFVKDWITMSGPSSAKAGMQGNSDSSNGSNCIYDEMIDELTDGDGSNRTEYWKMILLKREYVYNKPVVVKGADGCEMHRTFKLKTPHQETHVVCTNRGAAFTKGQEEPSEVKSALIDRAVVQFVRTLGQKTHDDQEFEDHISHPTVKRKLRIFRILTCLMGLLKMLIFRQQYLRPDMALAQKLFDQWDERLDRKYGLPRPSPRKNTKRLENLVTMCCLNAVSHVFLFKETAHRFEAGRTTTQFPKGKPFELDMLWECVPLLQPTREMIHQSWCMGLEYNIGTSSMGLNTMTIVAEICGRQIGDFFRNEPSFPDDKSLDSYGMDESELTDFAIQHETAKRREQEAAAAAAAKKGGSTDVVVPPAQAQQPLPQMPQRFVVAAQDTQRLGTELQRTFSSATSVMTNQTIDNAQKQMRLQREFRAEYRRLCSVSEFQNTVLRDAQRLVSDALGEEDTIGTMDLDARPKVGGAQPSCNVYEGLPRNQGRRPPSRAASIAGSDSSEVDALPPQQRGEYLYRQGRALDEGEDDRRIIMGFHNLRALDYPGSQNCCMEHQPVREHQLLCPYCATDVPDEVQVLEQQLEPVMLLRGASHVWPTQIEACMWYSPQTVLQWAINRAATVDPEGCPALGTRAVGSSFHYKQKTNSLSGAARVDIGWWQGKGEQWKSWHRTAEYVKNTGNRTVMEFDMHVDGLRDCLYLCSTRDNARRCPEEPRLPGHMRAERATTDMKGNVVGDHTACVKVAPYRVPGVKGDRETGNVQADHEHLKRHTDANMPDTKLQRRMDSMMHGGRLCALNVLTSNRIINSPPWRMNPSEGLEVNVGAIHDHMHLVAESVLACARQPGLRNMQEEFCNNQPGPDGLSAPIPKEAPGAKRRAAAVPTAEGSVHTLPYSYDIVAMALALDTASMLYDDEGTERAATALAKEAALGLSIGFNDLPHLTLRYIGYQNVNRQTLSIKIPCTKPEDQLRVEAGDPAQSTVGTSMAHVRRSLGKQVTDDDVSKYISRRQGARSMGGVTGDLFASSTWIRHTVASLRERGLVCGDSDETPVKAFADMEQCVHARVVERKSELKQGKYKNMGMFLATPGSYAAEEKRSMAEVAGTNSQPKRAREIDNLRFDTKTADFGSDDEGEEEAEAEAESVREQLHFGIGPMDDSN